MFGYKCTTFIFVLQHVYKVRKGTNQSKEGRMSTRNSFNCMGTSALKASSRSQLRLVYDSRTNVEDNYITSQRPNVSNQRGSALVLATFVMLLIVGAMSMFVADCKNTAIASTLNNANTQTIHAAVGDSLWSIASRHGVEGVSTYDVVQWIKLHNNKESSALCPGEALIVPVVSS